MNSKPCEGQECYELIYEAQMILPHDFRITKVYSVGRKTPSECDTLTESEKEELEKQFEKKVVKILEQQSSSFSDCCGDCECRFNGRLSEWSAWMEYPNDLISTIGIISKSNVICEWKLSGYVKLRYKKRLGDCFSKKLFKTQT